MESFSLSTAREEAGTGSPPSPTPADHAPPPPPLTARRFIPLGSSTGSGAPSSSLGQGTLLEGSTSGYSSEFVIFGNGPVPHWSASPAAPGLQAPARYAMPRSPPLPDVRGQARLSISNATQDASATSWSPNARRRTQAPPLRPPAGASPTLEPASCSALRTPSEMSLGGSPRVDTSDQITIPLPPAARHNAWRANAADAADEALLRQPVRGTIRARLLNPYSLQRLGASASDDSGDDEGGAGPSPGAREQQLRHFCQHVGGERGGSAAPAPLPRFSGSPRRRHSTEPPPLLLPARDHSATRRPVAAATEHRPLSEGSASGASDGPTPPSTTPRDVSSSPSGSHTSRASSSVAAAADSTTPTTPRRLSLRFLPKRRRTARNSAGPPAAATSSPLTRAVPPPPPPPQTPTSRRVLSAHSDS